MPLLLLVLNAAGFDDTDEGVADRFDSTLRFFDGGGFLVIVAVPFFVLEGAGRFLDAVLCSGADTSVEGTGTDDSRSGDCTRRLCSLLSEAMAFNVELSESPCCIDDRRASIGEDACGVCTGSCLMLAGEEGMPSICAAMNEVVVIKGAGGEGGLI